MRLTLILSLVIAVLAVIFALQNPGVMDLRLGPVDLQGSTALVLIVTFVAGVVVGLLATIPGRFKQRRKVRELKKGGQSKDVQSDPSAAEPESSYSVPPASDV